MTIPDTLEASYIKTSIGYAINERSMRHACILNVFCGTVDVDPSNAPSLATSAAVINASPSWMLKRGVEFGVSMFLQGNTQVLYQYSSYRETSKTY